MAEYGVKKQIRPTDYAQPKPGRSRRGPMRIPHQVLGKEIPGNPLILAHFFLMPMPAFNGPLKGLPCLPDRQPKIRRQREKGFLQGDPPGTFVIDHRPQDRRQVADHIADHVVQAQNLGA